ncbi:class I SAM-dependent methyltransferase [Planomonospora sp. ID67723]|uniref:class I SAM-dependent methyltransferase n=1 Tax=Planomonospora sp. ID67723 TaxID=2738134 RepID=UPI0018C44C50|nr:class I SAM-dependent methyltransferase [Planomonospora sp. ID67723]MBG0829108.1 class I SAM-dependent methyltransferase [Planomonospora sp. ID67723]
METSCRICSGPVKASIDLGDQPRGNAFPKSGELTDEFFYRLLVGMCDSCAMVQLMADIPQEVRYHDQYPYRASNSSVHSAHFTGVARRLMATELTGHDPFIVEIGCNDGVMLATIADSGVRHLGVEPSQEVAALARSKGIRILSRFFDEETASDIRAEHGPADAIFGANVIAHISHLDSVLKGVRTLLGPDGVFVFEEPYLGAVVEQTAFDLLYDEHSFVFSVSSIHAAARLFGLELVDAEPLAIHGGSMRYTLAQRGARPPAPAVADLLATERAQRLDQHATLEEFARRAERVRDDLTTLLRELRADGKRVAGYGAPAKITTVTNYCGIGTDLIPYVCDSTPAKQDRVVAGSHIPVVPPSVFLEDRPDYAVLFAWNHAEEIMAKESGFTGRWIVYVPEVRII